ncbi:DNA polymerase IV [Demetria terragena]|uniref:DNA polymerase IV n=1 Tax=Demetria terragena TaxID=63959 RepID=UPI0003796983|nr:DNA polymerase IV [Demetria terragena]
MPGDATILHADLDSFYASVEQRDDFSLQGRPVIVGGGVVLAASYEAKAFGVRTAMGGRQALQLCPQAVVVRPRMSAYSAASKAVFEVFHDTTPIVEALSIDEAFLDVGGLRRISGTPEQIAHALRTNVAERVGLPISVGVARTKFLAKVASASAKPDGLLVVEPDHELDFLHPLPVERLWGVGKVTAAKLHAADVRVVRQIADLPEARLVELLGPSAGRHLHGLALGVDPRPVRARTQRRSIGAQSALGRRRRSAAELDGVLAGLCDRVCRRLRTAERTTRTVTLRLRFDDFTRVTRSHTQWHPTDRTEEVLRSGRDLLRAAMPMIEERGITLLGVALGNLDYDAGQLILPVGEPDTGALDASVDQVRDRFGSGALTRGTLVGRELGPSVPLLPD